MGKTAKAGTKTSPGPQANVQFTVEADADLGTMKKALNSSLKEKFGESFLGLTVSTTEPARRRLKRRRLAKTMFYVTALLAGKASDLSSSITDFVSKGGLVASLKKQNLCSSAKPCEVTTP